MKMTLVYLEFLAEYSSNKSLEAKETQYFKRFVDPATEAYKDSLRLKAFKRPLSGLNLSNDVSLSEVLSVINANKDFPVSVPRTSEYTSYSKSYMMKVSRTFVDQLYEINNEHVFFAVFKYMKHISNGIIPERRITN